MTTGMHTDMTFLENAANSDRQIFRLIYQKCGHTLPPADNVKVFSYVFITSYKSMYTRLHDYTGYWTLCQGWLSIIPSMVNCVTSKLYNIVHVLYLLLRTVLCFIGGILYFLFSHFWIWYIIPLFKNLVFAH